MKVHFRDQNSDNDFADYLQRHRARRGTVPHILRLCRRPIPILVGGDARRAAERGQCRMNGALVDR
ncbi:hypothetical protein ACF1AU_32080 [Streptomyces rubrogriseus]|uniref:hypothetical protein n=1 Tax=Streptomyces rubrogriseus TaxID=194673 RepID=UPI0037004165